MTHQRVASSSVHNAQDFPVDAFVLFQPELDKEPCDIQEAVHKDTCIQSEGMSFYFQACSYQFPRNNKGVPQSQQVIAFAVGIG